MKKIQGKNGGGVHIQTFITINLEGLPPCRFVEVDDTVRKNVATRTGFNKDGATFHFIGDDVIIRFGSYGQVTVPYDQLLLEIPTFA